MKYEITFEVNKKINANINVIVISTDQPVQAGGEGTAPSPFDLFLASIGTCAGFYIKSFCDMRKIPTDGIKITQELEYNKEIKLISKINVEVDLPEDFPMKYKDALLNAANLCTVKRHLAQAPEISVYTK